MIWGKTKRQREEMQDLFRKESWFAWFPVILENGQWCWLERVHRRWCTGAVCCDKVIQEQTIAECTTPIDSHDKLLQALDRIF